MVWEDRGDSGEERRGLTGRTAGIQWGGPWGLGREDEDHGESLGKAIGTWPGRPVGRNSAGRTMGLGGENCRDSAGRKDRWDLTQEDRRNSAGRITEGGLWGLGG